MSVSLLKREIESEFALLDKTSETKKVKNPKKLKESLSSKRHGLKRELKKLHKARSESEKFGKNKFRINDLSAKSQEFDLDAEVQRLREISEGSLISSDFAKSIEEHTKRQKRFREKALSEEEQKELKRRKEEAEKSVFTEEDFENLRNACFIHSKPSKAKSEWE